MNRRSFLQSAAASASVVRASAQIASQRLRAGAAATNITPPLGSSLAGNFTDIRSTENHDELLVKSLVLERGSTRIALVLCDLCVLPSGVVARARALVEQRTGIPADAILVAATHTHSATTTMPVFQARPDAAYLDWLALRIADCVTLAAARLEPARLGWAFGEQHGLAFNRRFYLKPGAMPPNPFGGIDKVKMNPGVGNPNVVKPAGPTDPTVGVLAVERADGSPVAVLGNFSLHYVGGQPRGHVSADYFAFWASAITRDLGLRQDADSPPFVAMLFNGAQGDINNIDVFGKREARQPYQQMQSVAEALARQCLATLKRARFEADPAIGSSLHTLEIATRLPSPGDLALARQILAGVDPAGEVKELPQVYARETLHLAERGLGAERVPVQSFRIGALGITAFSGEPFVEMGLEIRKRSAFREHFVVGLSNDHVGYVPTERAFEEGGYETWRAKTSYLHPSAARRMTDTALRQLAELKG